MNKVVLITGSAQGIGEAIAYRFAKEGYDVILNDYFNYDKIALVEENIAQKYFVKVKGYKADISNETEVQTMLKDAISFFGKIDVLINNAGIVTDLPIEDRELSMFEATIRNNLTGTYIISKEISKYMKKGSIINISSTNGIDTVYPTSIDYDASKAGIISLTKNFAILLAPNISVNSIAPGWVNTEMNKQLPEEFLKEEQSRILKGRFAEPEEIAGLALFLASKDGEYITGQTIRIDGGLK